MALDPSKPLAADQASRTAERLADLERRLSALERGNPTIQVIGGAPTTAPRDGTPAADVTNNRLWLRLGGGWRYVTLT